MPTTDKVLLELEAFGVKVQVPAVPMKVTGGRSETAAYVATPSVPSTTQPRAVDLLALRRRNMAATR